MKTLNYLVWMYALILTFFISINLVVEKSGPTSKLPEDRFYFYSQRSVELNQRAQCELAHGLYRDYHSTTNAVAWAATLAKSYRDRYNSEQAIRLWRALAITGDPKMYEEAYQAHKL